MDQLNDVNALKAVQRPYANDGYVYDDSEYISLNLLTPEASNSERSTNQGPEKCTTWESL